MDLSYLRSFYEVAKAGKFAEAAKRNHISVSALSRAVTLLERTENVILFDRSKDGVQLTSKGHEVYRLCERLFGVEKEIETVCRGIQEKCFGHLSFAVSDHLIDHLILDPLQKFRALHPEVVPRIFSGSPDEIAYFLQSTDCEFAIMFAKMSTPQFQTYLLRKEPMTLVVQTEIWKEHRSSSHDKTLEKILSRHGYISSIGAHRNRRLTQTLTEVFGKVPNIGIEINSQEQQKRFCLAGAGVAYLPHFMVKSEIEAEKLFEIPVDFLRDLDLWLVRLKGRFMNYNARSFLKHLFPEAEIQ